ncbi:MAG TPA: peptidoglycan editing factor PgeF [Steroidobacteraceae bacterium]|nr:peptidoglycan editing factor PgeF [Steroidobacteraceae bacterium]
MRTHDAGVALLRPQWPVPASVQAAFTLRAGGVSLPPYDALNVGAAGGDPPERVVENRRRLAAALALPSEPVWLDQIHGTQVANLDEPWGEPASGATVPLTRARADAAVTHRAHRVCAIQVADCMPVLFAAADGSALGAAHAGWRGLASGVLEATVAALAVEPRRLIAWLGPAIGPEHFEVGDEVREAFLARDAQASLAFAPNARGRWQCDLYALARQRLGALGVGTVLGGGWCTYCDETRFFSYRRDGRCGRMAALLWRES